MTDYIERDIWKSMPDDLPYKGAVKRVLMQAPAADVRPVIYGKWVDESGHIPHCSVCGKYSDDADTGCALWCAFCGAYMVPQDATDGRTYVPALKERRKTND